MRYWTGRLSVRALDPSVDDDGEDYETRVKALTAADVQAAARTFTSGTNRVRVMLEPERGAR